jgi:hypothetical protein
MRLVFIMEEKIIRLREGKGNGTFTNVILGFFKPK